jgi:hypothetical protein
MSKSFEIKNPILIVFGDDEGKLITRIHRPEGWSHKHYGMLMADIVRHVARAFEVREDDVWEWVDKERDHPTTEVEEIKPQ